MDLSPKVHLDCQCAISLQRTDLTLVIPIRWLDDLVQRDDADFVGGVNTVQSNYSRGLYDAKFTFFLGRWSAYICRPGCREEISKRSRSSLDAKAHT